MLLKCYYNTKLMSNLRSVNSSTPSWNVLELSSHPMATNLLDLNYQLFLKKNTPTRNLGRPMHSHWHVWFLQDHITSWCKLQIEQPLPAIPKTSGCQIINISLTSKKNFSLIYFWPDPITTDAICENYLVQINHEYSPLASQIQQRLHAAGNSRSKRWTMLLWDTNTWHPVPNHFLPILLHQKELLQILNADRCAWHNLLKNWDMNAERPAWHNVLKNWDSCPPHFNIGDLVIVR